jgi:hypothetical protein
MQTADAAPVRILALENAWNQAEEHKDIKAPDSLLDASVVYVDYDGSIMDKALDSFTICSGCRGRTRS